MRPEESKGEEKSGSRRDRTPAPQESPSEKAERMHPLELIPYFRRWPHSPARDMIYTVIFSLMISMGFIIFGLPSLHLKSFGEFGELVLTNVAVALGIGFTWHFVMNLLGPLLRRVHLKDFWSVIGVYTVLGFGITVVGFLLVSVLPGYENIRKWIFSAEALTSVFAISFVISFIIGVAFRNTIAGLTLQAQLAQERERLEAAERAAVQANLRALQAQIEPHFLFNTLANVTGLIHKEPDLAKRMLEEFIAYLRATLAATREEQTTVGQEFALMKNFLAVLQIRMGERLQVSFDLPAELASQPLPHMLLQPLVENAIKHGLEPFIDGGELSLSARRDGELLTVTVADTGVGFANTTSGGVGLQNVRERLAKLFGGAARITIEDNEGRGAGKGTRVTLSIPMNGNHNRTETTK